MELMKFCIVYCHHKYVIIQNFKKMDIEVGENSFTKSYPVKQTKEPSKSTFYQILNARLNNHLKVLVVKIFLSEKMSALWLFAAFEARTSVLELL